MNDTSNFQILALAGSYRSGSYNQALIAAAREVAPPGVEIVDFDLRDVPHYDGDLEAAGDPDPVLALKEAVGDADALLVVTPEYNSGVPGVLKNGIDWSSRAYPNAPIGGKLVAVIGATPGRSGTKFAQDQVRQVLERTGAVVIDGPELLLARAGDAIEDGTVTASEVRDLLAAVIKSIVETAKLCDETGSSAIAG